jgi:hypothetical protein
MTKTTWGAWVIGAACLLVGARARAEGEPGAFGSAHEVVVSAERLFGFVHASETENEAGTDVTITTNSFSLLGNPLTIFSLFTTPHVAFDFFVADHFSVGGTASYFRLSESQPNVAGQGVSGPTFTGFSFSPRLGASVALGPFVQFWPHLGFSLLHLTTDDNNTAADTSTISLYALTVDAPFVFTVAPHFFLSVAPTMDLGLGGSNSSSNNSIPTPSPSQSAKETDFGVLVGLGGYL